MNKYPILFILLLSLACSSDPFSGSQKKEEQNNIKVCYLKDFVKSKISISVLLKQKKIDAKCLNTSEFIMFSNMVIESLGGSNFSKYLGLIKRSNLFQGIERFELFHNEILKSRILESNAKDKEMVRELLDVMKLQNPDSYKEHKSFYERKLKERQ